MKSRTSRGSARICAPRRWTLSCSPAFAALALVSFFRKSVRLKYVTLVGVGRLPGVLQEPADLDRQRLRPADDEPADLQVQPRLVPVRRVHARVDGAVGPALLRPDLRVWRADAADGPRRAGEAPRRGAAPDRGSRRAGSSTASSARSSSIFSSTRDISAYRYVEPFWMFTLKATTGLWIALGVLLVATVFVRNLYCRFLCPVGALLGLAVQADGVPHQALVGVQDLQDLREDVRVGRDSRAENREERVRAVRRLRAALHGHEEMSRTGSSSGAKATSWRVSRRSPPPISRSFSPDEMSTSFLSVTITPSTPGSRSMSAMPAAGPRTKTPVASPSASDGASGHDRHAAASVGRLAQIRIQDVMIAAAVLHEEALVVAGRAERRRLTDRASRSCDRPGPADRGCRRATADRRGGPRRTDRRRPES